MPTMYLKWPNSLKKMVENFIELPPKAPAMNEQTFKAMRAALPEKEKTSTAFDPQGEAALYLRALADTRVFFEKAINVTSMQEIFKSAIEAEKDSIVFYLGMKEAVPESLGKGRIDRIIKEEMGHIRLLSKKLVQHKG